MKEPSGKFLTRIDRHVHLALIRKAEEEGVSLNHLILCILSQEVGRREALRHREETGTQTGHWEPFPWYKALCA